MIKKTILLILFAVLAVSSFAQLEEELTVTYCGNNKYDKYELCEPEIKDFCPEIGMMLDRIVMVCNERNCGCLPGRTAIDCGNNVREGTEMCDAGIDYCPELGEMMGLELKCNPDTCLCKPASVVSYCGDGRVQGEEECEDHSDCPDGTYCNTCTCTDFSVEEKTLKDLESEIQEEVEETAEATEEQLEAEEGDISEVLEEEKAGFFKRIWLWFIGLFS